MHQIGSTIIKKVHEMDLNSIPLQQLMPEFRREVFTGVPEKIFVGTSDEAGHAFISLHTWIVRHGGRTILIDTGAGNDKDRPHQLVLDHLSTPFLGRLATAGVAPSDVDVILHTHIHCDHV